MPNINFQLEKKILRGVSIKHILVYLTLSFISKVILVTVSHECHLLIKAFTVLNMSKLEIVKNESEVPVVSG